MALNDKLIDEQGIRNYFKRNDSSLIEIISPLPEGKGKEGKVVPVLN
jgi:hypothetical protein